jgi:hypothetical protein
MNVVRFWTSRPTLKYPYWLSKVMKSVSQENLCHNGKFVIDVSRIHGDLKINFR